MYKRIITLLAVFTIPASMSFAQTKSLPKGWTKEEVEIFASIEAEAGKILSSDKVAALKTPEIRIKHAFTQLVEAFGADYRLVIAKAVSGLVPDEFHGYVAKRALSYSPLRAKELLASLSNGGANSSVSSALSSLPTRSIHTVSTAGAAGVALDQPGRVFQLPQVDARRRVESRNSAGRVTEAVGTGDPDGVGGDPPISVTVVLGGTQDNGFTSDGLGYTLTDTNTGDLIGVYLVLEEVSATEFKFRFKNTIPNDPNPGSGPALEFTLTGILP